MNSAIKSVFLIAIVFVFVACNAEKSVKPIVDREQISDRIAAYDPFEIDTTYAKTSILAYKNYIDSVSKYLKLRSPLKFPRNEEKLNYGVEVDIKELREILLKADSTQTRELYAMNAIMGGGADDSAAIIFALKSIPKLDSTKVATWRYFDFTKPCPTYCPKIYGVDLQR